MLELCRSLSPINLVSAELRDQQPWKHKATPQHGSCHQLICQSCLFFKPHHEGKHTSLSLLTHHQGGVVRPPVQCEAAILKNPQKHTNIGFHILIAKVYRLYVFSVFFMYKYSVSLLWSQGRAVQRHSGRLTHKLSVW